jgi:NADH-ubiquinone oxidoreductase chain 2
LAYSTISHVGFILLALAVNTEQSIESFIFYIVQYTLTNLNTFLIILALGYLINYNIFTKSQNLAGSWIGRSKTNRSFNNPVNSTTEGGLTKNNKPLAYATLGEGIASFISFLDKDIRFISELRGQFFANPLLSISLAICLFSMAGIYGCLLF